MSATVERIRFGAIVKVPDSEQKVQPHMVMHACGQDRFPAFYCDSCDAKVANLGNLILHVEAHGEGPHRVVAFCKTHKWFEEVGDPEYAELQKAGLVAT